MLPQTPQWVSSEQVPAETVAKEKEIVIAQMKDSGKPEQVLEKIAEGKIKKFFEENCLLSQAYVKDTDKTIEQVLKEAIAGLGENIAIRRFARFGLGDSLAN